MSKSGHRSGVIRHFLPRPELALIKTFWGDWRDSNPLTTGSQPAGAPYCLQPHQKPLRVMSKLCVRFCRKCITFYQIGFVIHRLYKFLSLFFILLFLLVLVLVIKPSGFTSDQRLVLIIAVLVLIALVLIFGVVLAMQRGGLLYSPYERSLARGTSYGNSERPRTKAAVC